MSAFHDASHNGSAATAGQPAAAVSVVASARLHLGFLDPSGTLGRRFGSLGMMIDGLATRVQVAHAEADHVDADTGADHEIDRLRRLVGQLKAATGRNEPLVVRINEALPPHVGLGSGTQLALALGRAFSELHGLGLSTPAIANLLDRGARSGIGIAGFDHGGVLVDGGPRAGANAPPVLARFDFPADWRVILVLDRSRRGLHGNSEKEGIARLPIFERGRAANLCHLVLMQILPALAEADFAPFAAGLSELQANVGEYFAPAQGGIYSSPAVAQLMRWVAERYPAGIGQSSWGPTAFAILPSETRAQEVLRQARAYGVTDELVATIVTGRNAGARVVRHPVAPAVPAATARQGNAGIAGASS